MPIVVYGFETSNNMKVRVALGYKGLDYEFRAVDPSERDELLRLSGQSLTPVLHHDDRIVYDSGAILRYLDVTFPDTPRLFGRDRLEQWKIEDWELFGRARLAEPMMKVVHTKVSGGTVDAAMFDECAAQFADRVAELAEGLGDRAWLVGDAMSAADITSACVMHRVRDAGIFPLPESANVLGPWVDRVMAFDRPPG